MSIPVNERTEAAIVIARTAAAAVIDTGHADREREGGPSGLPDGDAEEFVLHFTDTVQNILDALLPVLADAMDRTLAPLQWWAVDAGESTLIMCRGRLVVVPSAQSEEFLLAVKGEGQFGHLRVW